MSISNRAQRIEKLAKALKKAFRSVPPPTERTVLETLVYACCLEDASHEQADEAFAKLTQTYVDWNEVRVTTVAELAELLAHLVHPHSAAVQLKRTLQSLFEKRYSFDLEELRKQNLGKAQAEIESWGGMSRFVAAYIAQNAFGGHAIPVGAAHLQLLLAAEIIVPAEAEKQTVPGLERAIPKNAGVEFAGLLHQAAMAFRQTVRGEDITALFKALKLELPPPPVEAAKLSGKPAKVPRVAPAARGDAGDTRPSTSGGAKGGGAKAVGGAKAAGDKPAAAKGAPAKSAPAKPASAKIPPAKPARTAPQQPAPSKVTSKAEVKKSAGSAKGATKPDQASKPTKKASPGNKPAPSTSGDNQAAPAKPTKADRAAGGDKSAGGKAGRSAGPQGSAAKASKSPAVKLTKKKPK